MIQSLEGLEEPLPTASLGPRAPREGHQPVLEPDAIDMEGEDDDPDLPGEDDDLDLPDDDADDDAGGRRAGH